MKENKLLINEEIKVSWKTICENPNWNEQRVDTMNWLSW